MIKILERLNSFYFIRNWIFDKNNESYYCVVELFFKYQQEYILYSFCVLGVKIVKYLYLVGYQVKSELWMFFVFFELLVNYIFFIY